MHFKFPYRLSYLPIKFTLVSMERARLPAFLGSALRGIIGKALMQNHDLYDYFYYNRNTTGNRKDLVHPYIISLPLTNKTLYEKGEALTFTIILLGDAIQYANSFIHAVIKMDIYGIGVLRYPFHLVKLTHCVDQRIIWKDGILSEIALRSVPLSYHTIPDVRQVQIHIQTPLRIRRNSELLDDIDFGVIIRNITYRMEMFACRFKGFVDKEEIEHLHSLVLSVHASKKQLVFENMERYSNRTHEKMDFRGLVGDVWFEGDITPFVPWLYAAQILHLGGNTTFGMGQIEVEFL